MEFLSAIGGILGGLGGMFGDKGSTAINQTEKFDKTSQSKTEASATDLSPELLKTLEGLFQSVVGGGGMQTSSNAIGSRLTQILAEAQKPQFDVAGYAKGITDQASAAAGLNLESGINGLASKAGSSEGGNSMIALLGNKLRNETAANLAGISSKATMEGEQIRGQQQQSITESIRGLGGDLSSQILQLIQQTRGATTAGETKGMEHVSGTSTINSNSNSSSKTNPFSSFGDFFKSMTNAKANA